MEIKEGSLVRIRDVIMSDTDYSYGLHETMIRFARNGTRLRVLEFQDDAHMFVWAAASTADIYDIFIYHINDLVPVDTIYLGGE